MPPTHRPSPPIPHVLEFFDQAFVADRAVLGVSFWSFGLESMRRFSIRLIGADADRYPLTYERWVAQKGYIRSYRGMRAAVEWCGVAHSEGRRLSYAHSSLAREKGSASARGSTGLMART
jgi:hypothetical protein